ncbi:MAG: hypothetical protein MUE40_04855 [Anaerolineae bacterium]|jgi:hypothetical protein|nr:hypothetical protein [Anaerolineae bacterium]
MSLRHPALLLVALLLALPARAQAQAPTPTPPVQVNAEVADVVPAFFTASSAAPLLGEPFTLRLTVEVPAGVSLVRFPELPAEPAPFMVLSRSAVTQQAAPSGAVTYQQELTAVLWATGLHLTPEIAVEFVAGGVPSSNLVQSASFNVPSVLDPSQPPALYPALPPQDLPYLSPWWAVLVVIVVGTVLYALRVLLRPRRGAGPAGRVPATPAQIALAELEDLKLQTTAAALVYPLVANILRQYVQQRYGIGAVEMTTAELVEALRPAGVPEALRKGLFQVLEQADLVKFARFVPDASATVRLVNFAMRWLHEADAQESAAV